MNTKIDYKYVYFNFDWNWIKDKQIIHKGNDISGALYILDSDGNLVRGYGYDLIV
jgi:hypothetical protein